MKKTNNGVVLEFTDEEVKAFDIALPLLVEIAEIMEESSGVIHDENNNVSLVDEGDMCNMEYISQALLHKKKVRIDTDF